MRQTASFWIRRLHLKPHPEGGYFRETYRSPERLKARRFRGPRVFSTAIYYLLKGTQFSAFHRIRSDELWHFYAGGGLTLYLLKGGRLSRLRLGLRPERGETPQAVVPAGTWFAATVNDPASYALVGCTVAPGFDFRDFQWGNRRAMARRFPAHKRLITKLARKES